MVSDYPAETGTLYDRGHADLRSQCKSKGTSLGALGSDRDGLLRSIAGIHYRARGLPAMECGSLRGRTSASHSLSLLYMTLLLPMRAEHSGHAPVGYPCSTYQG